MWFLSAFLQLNTFVYAHYNHSYRCIIFASRAYMRHVVTMPIHMTLVVPFVHKALRANITFVFVRTIHNLHVGVPQTGALFGTC